MEQNQMSAARAKETLWTMVGVTAGVAAGVWLWTRGREAAWRERLAESEDQLGRSMPRGSAQDVAAALSSDQRLRRRRIQVDTIAEGVVELTGSVQNRAESSRAVALAQGTTGVYTVVNRLTIGEEEAHLEDSRRRWEEGAPEMRERHHYGMGVGMGTRRQSPSTDPDRPSDKQRLIERQLEVRRVGVDDAGVADRMDVAGDAARTMDAENPAMPEPEGRAENEVETQAEPETPDEQRKEGTG